MWLQYPSDPNSSSFFEDSYTLTTFSHLFANLRIQMGFICPNPIIELFLRFSKKKKNQRLMPSPPNPFAYIERGSGRKKQGLENTAGGLRPPIPAFPYTFPPRYNHEGSCFVMSFRCFRLFFIQGTLKRISCSRFTMVSPGFSSSAVLASIRSRNSFL